MDTNSAHFGLEDATPGSRACVRVRAFLGRVGRAGLPGAFWCASPFLWPVLVRSLFARPPLGWSCPFSFCAPPLSLAFRVLRPGVPWAVVSCCPPFLPTPPLFFCSPPVYFLCALPLSVAFRVFRPGVPWALAPSCAPAPPLVCFFSTHPPCLFFVFFVSCFCFVSWFFFAGCLVQGWFVCPGLSGVPVCASVVLSLSLPFVR